MKNNLKRLPTSGYMFTERLAECSLQMLRARYPIARGTLEKLLEPRNHQMSILADILLNRKQWMQHGTHAGSIYTSLLSV